MQDFNSFISGSRSSFAPASAHHHPAGALQQDGRVGAPVPSGQAPAPGLPNLSDEIVRTFNTALITSKASSERDLAGEIKGSVETPAFQVILTAIREYSRSQGVSERHAAEVVISTFRKLDQLWSEYVYQEGLARLRGGK